jgi:hypothetical protein
MRYTSTAGDHNGLPWHTHGSKRRHKLLDEEREKVTLLWVPGHMGIPGNEIADEEAKAALQHDFLTTKKYPPQYLIKWIKTEDKKTRKARWQNSDRDRME